MDNLLLEMKHITKIYPNGVMANKDVSLSVQAGEIHALMGENGAGKSTLMNILFGVQGMDEGSIFFQGEEITKMNSHKAIALGIGMVHQHFMLVDSLRVYENVLIGMEPTKHGCIDNQKAYDLVQKISETYNLKVNPDAKIADLSVGLKQKVEIIKVLARGVKLLILDEPTAVLTPQETEELFEQLALLKKSGHTVIFISHKIKEVKKICDRLTVLRGGKTVGTMDVADATEEEISSFMVGREVILKVEKSKASFGDLLLDVQNLELENREGKKLLDRISFQVKSGQILGIAGVEGNGQNELAEVLFGLRKDATGVVSFKNKNLLQSSIRNIRDLGVSCIPEDRMTTGIAMKEPIWANLVSDRIDTKALRVHGLLSLRKIKSLAHRLVQEFSILCRNVVQPVAMLSGGNIQKVVVAREMSSNPDLLIANQPTRGIDIGANEFIWKKLISLRDNQRGVILISADLNEVLELSDSILVMHDGHIAAYFEDVSEVDEYQLGLYMLGIKKQEREVV